MLRLNEESRPGCRSAALAVLCLILTLAACDRKPKEAPARPAPEVSVITVEPQAVLLTTELSGRTAPYVISEIRPRVNGLILKRLFTEGSDVQAGQILYQIDPAPFEAELNNALAALGKAEANLPAIQLRAERYRALLADKALSQQDYDDAAASLNQLRAEIKAQQAAVDTARINLGYTKVTAPISGRIGKSNVTEGAIVTAYQQTALATIQQLDPIYVDVPQSTTDLLSIKSRLQQGLINHQGQDLNKVKLILDNGTPYPLEGTLKFSDVTVEPSTGSVTLRAVFPNPDGLVLPGMFVKAVVREGVSEKAILIPQQSVARDYKGNPYAFVVTAENKIEQRSLTLDRAIASSWLVTGGLTPGERLVVEGLQSVRHGMTVRPVSPAAQNATSSQSRTPGAGEGNS
jgi:membrane fusion protein (multidrug efflux system)